MTNDMDKLALDAAVAGLLPEDSPTWTALLASPSAAEAWEDATQHRARVERIVKLSQRTPWLAQALLVLRRGARSRRTREHGTVSVGRLGDLAAATLAAPAQDRGVHLAWGGHDVVAEPADTLLTISAPDGAQLFFRSEDDSGPFSGQWRVVPADGVVAILAVKTQQPLSDFDEAMAAAAPKALLIVQPTAPGEKDD